MAEEVKFDMTLIKTFVEGTVDTMRVQCNIDAQVGKPYKVGEGRDHPVNIEIVGIIGLTSKTFNGSIALCFTENSFMGVMSGMLGEQITEINQDIQDGAGELLNIIFGFTKRVLNKKGHEIEMAIPSVVRGKDIEVQQHAKLPPIIVPFTSSAGEFFVKIAVS
jgi:chemotaxis protein CheX